MSIQESGENYLETILILKERNGVVRSVDIAAELGFSKPSISRAMSILKKNGYIEVNEEGHIELTKTGNEKAAEIYERHQLLTKYLVTILDVDKKIAAEDACRIEHVISEETFQKIKGQLNN
jgi:Mn-dependent DtxR family transcriptional regulator